MTYRLAILLLFCVLSISAKDIQVRQTANGTTNSIDWLNASTNWNGVIIAPGDLIHGWGTFTTSLQVQGNGTPGNPITFLFEAGCKFSKPTWGQYSVYSPTSQLLSDTAIWCENALLVHDFVIDGGTDGIIESTSDGNGGSYTNKQSGIWLYASKNVEVKNLRLLNLSVYFGSDEWVGIQPYFTNYNGSTNWTAQNVYDNWPGHTNWWATHSLTPPDCITNAVPCTNHYAFELPIYFKYPSVAPQGIRLEGDMTNCSIHNCYVDHAGNGVFVVLGGGVSTNVQVYSNSMYHCSWGLGWLQSIPDSLCLNSAIWANRIDGATNWNGNPAGLMGNNPNHGDGMLVNCQGARATNFNMRIYRNYIGPNMGTNLTALIWQETTWSAISWQGLMIYNNLFVSGPLTRAANGLLGCNGDAVLIANNTFAGSTNSFSDPPYGIINSGSAIGIAVAANGAMPQRLTNNVFSLVSSITGTWANFDYPMNGPGFDYNLYLDVFAQPDPNQEAWAMHWATTNNSGYGTTLWTGHTNTQQDLHSHYLTNVVINSDYSLPTNNPTVISGLVLSNYFTTDFYGVTRTNWTRGAFEGGGVAQSGDTNLPASSVTAFRGRFKL